MISIFNQIHIPWSISDEVGKAISFNKRQTYISNGTERNVFIKINGMSSLIDDIEKSNLKLNDCVDMIGPETVVSANTSVNFKRKNLKPFIVSSEDNVRDVLIFSFDIFRSKIFDISGSGFYVLETMIRSNVFNGIVCFNNPRAKIVIDIYNIERAEMITHTFVKSDDGKIMKSVEVSSDVKHNVEDLTFKVKLTRPSEPTYTLLIFKNDDLKFNIFNFKGVKKKSNKIVVDYTEESMGEVIKLLKEDHIDAVTLFANQNGKSEDYEYCKKFTTMLTANFSTVYHLMSKTGIKKIKTL